MEDTKRNELYQSIHDIIDVLDKEERVKLLLFLHEQDIRIYQHCDGSRVNLTNLTVEDLIVIKEYARSLMIPLSNLRRIDI